MNWRLVLFIGGAILVIGLVILVSQQQNAVQQQEAAAVAVLSGASYATLQGNILLAYSPTEQTIKTVDVITGVTINSIAEPTPVGSIFSWAPDGNHVAIFRLGTSPAIAMLNLTTQQQTTLNEHVSFPAWSSDGTRIAYQFVRGNPAKNTLTIADAQGKNFTSVMDIPTVYDQLWWGALAPYIIAHDASQQPPTYVRILLSSKVITPLATGTGNVRFSPSGKLAIIDQDTGSLGLVEVETGTVRNLSAQGAVDLCTWISDTTIQCVVQSNTQQTIATIRTTDGKVLTKTAISADTIDEVLGVVGDLFIYRIGDRVYKQKLL